MGMLLENFNDLLQDAEVYRRERTSRRDGDYVKMFDIRCIAIPSGGSSVYGDASFEQNSRNTVLVPEVYPKLEPNDVLIYMGIEIMIEDTPIPILPDEHLEYPYKKVTRMILP